MTRQQTEARWDNYTGKHVVLPAAVRHMLRYGVFGGALVGLAGLFILSDVLEKVLLNQPSLSLGNSFAIVGIIVLVLLVILGLLLAVLGRRWRAPSENARLYSGLAVGLGYALITHTLFVGSTIGVFTNRDSFQLLYRVYGNEDAAFLQIILDGTYRTVVEGIVLAVVFVLILTIVGGLFGTILIPHAEKEQEGLVLKDASGSIAIMVLPILFYAIAIINMVVYAVLPSTLDSMASDIDYQLITSFIMISVVFLPIILLIIVQLIGIIWVHNARPGNIHRMTLRAAQIVHILAIGIALIPVANFVSPGMLHNLFALTLHTLIVILAWIFGLFAQWKLTECKKVSAVRARVSVRSLIGAVWLVVIIGLLLIDLFSVRISLNLLNYTVEFIDYAEQSYVPVQAVIHDALASSFFGVLKAYGIIVGITLVVSTAVTSPILWGLNLFER